MVVGLGLHSARTRLGLALALASACGDAPETNAAPITSTEPTGWDDGMTSPDDDGTATGADETATGGEGNCGDMNCSGHGSCEFMDDAWKCVCDEGYVPDEDEVTCIVDENCVEIRYLENRCRQLVSGPPAVSLFFAADFCAGTAVLPEDMERLDLDFVVLEDGVDIEKNEESVKKIIPRSVESYVSVAIDVSGSIMMDENWTALVDEIRAFVQGLAPGADEPDVYVQIVLFGRDHGELVAFTRDLGAVDAALEVLTGDPENFEDVAGNADGTDLYDAVEFAINRTERAREFRNAVSWGGQLSTGTVVIVTDGTDQSGGMLDMNVIKETTNQVISVGVTADILDADLKAIGPDGSYLAPTPTDWSAAFDEILTRVDQYPRRSYLLAYCTARTEGMPQVLVGMKKASDPDNLFHVENHAACDFYPGYFSTDPDDVCTLQLFEEECTSIECGGITACGACDDDQCCDGIGTGQCVSPQSAIDSEVSCEGQTELCEQEGMVCGGPPPVLECVPPAGIGDPCSDEAPCEPGVGYCDEDGAADEGTCQPTLGLGEECGDDWESCASLHCESPTPDNPLENKVCHPGSVMFESCGSAVGDCEIGTYCAGMTCEPRLWDVETCSEDRWCRHADCVGTEGGTKVCGGPPACYFAWDDKFPN